MNKKENEQSVNETLKQNQSIDLSKVKIIFTGVEVDQILQYLSKRPWAEVVNIMDMLRAKLANTKVNAEEDK